MPGRESIHFLVILLLVFMALVGLLLVGFLAPVVFGILIAAVSYRLYRRIERGFTFNGKENLAAALTITIAALVILVPLTGIFTVLTREAISLIPSSGEISFEQQILDAFGGIADKFGFDLQTFLDTQLAPAL